MGIPIVLDNVTKSYGEKTVLNGVSTTFKANEVCLIFGLSGTGKSVLFNLISAFQKPTSGQIKVGELDLKGINEFNYIKKMDSTGVLFQEVALFDSLSIWENIAFYHLYNLNMDRNSAKQIALQNMAKVGLKPEVADLLPSNISGGMAKRAGIARIIARKPKVLLFDEPTTGLDPILTAKIHALIAEVSAEMQATTLLVTHDINALEHFNGRAIFIHEGKIIWDDAIINFRSTQNPLISQFLRGSTSGPLEL